MIWPGTPPTRYRTQAIRLLAMLGLALAIVVLLQVARHVSPERTARWQPTTGDAVFLGDLLYRAGQFVESQAAKLSEISWYRGYLLGQSGLALYERQALSGQPDWDALLRLGIIYSRSGQVGPGRGMLLRAAHLDPQRSTLCWRLIQLYSGETPDHVQLNQLPQLLGDSPRWLREMVTLDLYQVTEEQAAAQQAEQVWEAHLNTFGLVLVGIAIIVGLLVCGGGIVLLVWLLRLIIGSGPRRYRAPLQVSWNSLDVAEILVVLVFLLVLGNLALGVLYSYLPLPAAGGILRPLLLAVAYCSYMGLALWLVYRRASLGGRPWRLLGLRAASVSRSLWQGSQAYALFCLLAALVGKFALDQLYAGTVLLRGSESLSAYLVYFLLLCIIAPVVEEIIFRGFIYAGLRRNLRPGWAAALSALAFAGAHLPAATGTFLFIAALGFVLAVLYENTRSLLPAILLHAGHNALVFMVMIAAFAL